MKALSLAALWVIAAVDCALAVGPGPTLDLWPGAVPGGPHTTAEERDTSKAGDNRIADRPVVRLGNVARPTITVYRPEAAQATGAAVLVCPGGGYYILAMDLEGTEVCEWLNSIGVTAILLKYRVPKREAGDRHEMAVQDGQRAMGLIREHAKEWGIRNDRVGVLGFSAGAHLAAMLAAGPRERIYAKVDAADELSFRPDLVFLIYPGYLTVKEHPEQVAPELTVTSNSPPTFLTMAGDDPIGVETALGYGLALRREHVPFALHIYPSGGHGYGLRKTGALAPTWPARAEEWLRSLQWVNSPGNPGLTREPSAGEMKR